MSVVIGTLVIDLKANTSTFTQSMDKMSQLSGKTANDVKRSLEKISVAGIAMGLAIVTGTAALITSSIHAADRLEELAQAAGTTTETLSALGYAAKFSGVDTETLSATLGKLSKSAFGAQTGNETLRKSFKLLGVDIESSKGHLKDSGVIYQELASGFSKMADGAGKAAIARELFGKSGGSSIPILNQLGESNGELIKEARELGVVIGTDTAHAAGTAKDNLDRLQAVFIGAANSLMAVTLPALLKLSERLIQVGKDANIPDLARSFGIGVSATIDKLGSALEFAVKNAHALKIAFEALLALQFAKFAIPFAVELLTAGSLTAGVGKLTLSILGIGKLLPLLSSFGAWLAYTTRFVALLAAEEGIAAAATYVFGGAIAVITSPVTIVVGVISALAAGMYLLRDATFHAGGQIYALKDSYEALWQMITLRSKQGEPGWFAIGGWDKILGRVKQERQEREQAAKFVGPPTSAANPFVPKRKALETPDTSGLKKDKKDIYTEEIQRLNLAIAAQRAYLAVIGETPEKINAVAAAERAEAIILATNQKLHDQKRPLLTSTQRTTIQDKVDTEESTKGRVEYGRGIVGERHATDLSIQQQTALAGVVGQSEEAFRRVAVENTILGKTFGQTAADVGAMEKELAKLKTLLAKKLEVEGLLAFSKTIDDQRKTTELAIAQTEVLAAARLKGEQVVREVVASNAILALVYGKTALEVENTRGAIDRLAETQKRKAAADRLDSSNYSLNALRDELEARKGLPIAILQGEDAYRKAALAARLFGIDQKILEEDNKAVRDSLILQRKAMADNSASEHKETDARDSLSLRSVIAQYEEETLALNRQIKALTDGGKRALTYGEAQQVAARQQELLNKAIDAQVGALTRAGNARDGVDAFFRNMQKQAKSTAAIVYDALNSSFDKIASNFTNLLTGEKTNFGQAIKDIGKQIVGDTIKANIQKGLGAVGNALGISIGKPDGTETNPLWVRNKDAASALSGSIDPITGKLTDALKGGLTGSIGTAILRGTSGMKPQSSSTGGFFSNLLSAFLGSIFGGKKGAGASGESVSSTISYPAAGEDMAGLAEGGTVSPRSAYIVGEHGREILAGASGRIIDNAKTERLLQSGTNNAYYTIDARGTDPAQTESRVRKALLLVHDSAVSTSVQATVDLQRRSPQK